MKIRRYYIIEHKGNTIDITRDALLMGPLPVLWCNAGMYALIPGALLEDLFDISEVGHFHMHQIWWEQAYELPREVGLLLCDEGYNQTDNKQD